MTEDEKKSSSILSPGSVSEAEEGIESMTDKWEELEIG